MKYLAISDRILLTFWVGGLWAIGYIAAPTLFAMLEDRSLAGELAGQMFQIIHYLGLFCGLLLIINMLVRKTLSWQLWVIAAMLLLVVCNLFVIQPMMQELKAIGLVEGSDVMKKFGRLHGASEVVYMVTSLLGLLVVATGLKQSKVGEQSSIHN